MSRSHFPPSSSSSPILLSQLSGDADGFDPDAERGSLHSGAVGGSAAGCVSVGSAWTGISTAASLRRIERMTALLALLLVATLALLAHHHAAVSSAQANADQLRASDSRTLRCSSPQHTTTLTPATTPSRGTNIPPCRPAAPDGKKFACSWVFKDYAASSWESEWQQLVREHESPSQFRICPLLHDPFHWPRVVASVARVQTLMDGENKLPLRLVNTTANGALPSVFLSPRASFIISSPSWSDAEFRVHSDALLSHMNYELVCRDVSGSRGGGADRAPGRPDPFVVARGYDTIEPLVGLLRDSMTICPMKDVAPLPQALQPFLPHADPSGEMQSKRFILLSSASIFHFAMLQTTDEGAAHWPAAFDAGTRGLIHAAIFAQAQNSGVAPWMWQTAEYHRPLPPVPADWPYLHRPLEEQSAQSISVVQAIDAAAVLDGSSALPDANAMLQSQLADEITQSEEQQAIIVHVPTDPAMAPSVNFRSHAGGGAGLAADSATAARHRNRAAPRTLLFDLGASYFAGWGDDATALGTAWLTRSFGSKGYHFDHVYAFEFVLLDAKKEWSQIPAEMHAGFTWINVGVDCDPRDAENPWNWLLATARPSDFVVVKLDIDTSSIEEPLIEQLIAQPHLAALVDEMFFEHHTTIAEMSSLWGTKPQKPQKPLHASYDYFAKLRSMGIRMHSWP